MPLVLTIYLGMPLLAQSRVTHIVSKASTAPSIRAEAGREGVPEELTGCSPALRSVGSEPCCVRAICCSASRHRLSARVE